MANTETRSDGYVPAMEVLLRLMYFHQRTNTEHEAKVALRVNEEKQNPFRYQDYS